MLVAGSWDTMLSVWPLRHYTRSKDATILPPAPSHFLRGHDSRVAAVAASAALRLVASAGAGGHILLHHLHSGALLTRLQGHSAPAALIALSPLQPAAVAYLPAERELICWHVQGHELARARVQEDVVAMAVSPCGRMLVVGGGKGAPQAGGSGGGGGALRRAPVPTLLWLHSLKVLLPFWKLSSVDMHGVLPLNMHGVLPSACVACALRSPSTYVQVPMRRSHGILQHGALNIVSGPKQLKIAKTHAGGHAVQPPDPAERGDAHDAADDARRLHRRRHVDRRDCAARSGCEAYRDAAAEPGRLPTHRGLNLADCPRTVTPRLNLSLIHI